MNKFIVGGGVAGVVIAAGAATLVMTDSKIDSAIENAITNTPAPLELVILSDEGSLMSRSLVLGINYGPLTEEMGFSIILENDIQKRPWGSIINHTVKLDTAIINDIIDEEDKEIFTKLFIDQPLATGVTNISLTGSYQSDIQTLSIVDSIEEVEMAFHAMTINLNGNMNGDFAMTGEWPGIQIKGESDSENIDFDFKAMTFNSEGKYVDGMFFVGNQNFNGSGFDFSIEEEGLTVSTSSGAYSATTATELSDDRLSSNFAINFENINVDTVDTELTLEDLLLSVEVAGIDPENYMELMTGVNEMSINGQPNEELFGSVNSLLQNGFSFGFPEISAVVNGAKVRLDARVELPENDVADINNPMSLLGLVSAISAEANLAMDQAIAEVPETAEQVMMLMMMGIVQEQGDEYVLNASMMNGEATLNGEPVPLPF